MRDKIKYNEYQKQYQLTRYHRRRAEAIEKLGRTCTVCGSSDTIEIDHIDPEQKSFGVAKLWSVSEKKFQEELAKCQLLCHEHHANKSWNEESKREFECCGKVFVGKPAYRGHKRWCAK